MTLEIRDFVDLDHVVDLLLDGGKIKESSAKNYKNAIDNIGIKWVNPRDMDTVWTELTAQLEQSPGFVEQLYWICRSAMKIRRVEPEGEDHFNLVNKMKSRKKKVVTAHTVEQIQTMLRAAKFTYSLDFSLYRVLLLLYYTGARISSLKGITLNDFKQVKGVPVMSTFVIGKGKGEGHRYPIFIPMSLYNHFLNEVNPEGDPRITTYGNGEKSSFRNLTWSKLDWALSKYYEATRNPEEKKRLETLFFVEKDGKKIRNKNALHSYRKAFAQALQQSQELGKDIIGQALLMGHKVNTTTFSKYVNPDGANWNATLERSAKDYITTPLNSMKIWHNTEPILK